MNRFDVNDFPKSKKDKIINFKTKNQYILDSNSIYQKTKYEEVSLIDYFKIIFGRNPIITLNKNIEWEELIPFQSSQEKPQSNFVYNAIVLCKNNNGKINKFIVTKNPTILKNIKNQDFAIASPITYVGKNRFSKNARFLYAITIDLDFVGFPQIRDLLFQINNNIIPQPNIITNSGNGLHITYIIKEPIPMYKGAQNILNKLKYGLIDIIWNVYTSQYMNRQYQNVIQGYRLPESKTKFGEIVKSYFDINSNYHTIEELNSYLKDSEEHKKLEESEIIKINQIIKGEYDYKAKMEELKRLYPDWYERRIVKKEPRKKLTINKGVYKWWLNILQNEDEKVTIGHRYFCCLALVSFGTKCNIPYEEVKADLYSLVNKFDTKTLDPDNHFTSEDIESALLFYGSQKALLFSRENISNFTNIKIEKRKRNGLTREQHLKIVNFSNKIKRENGLIQRPKKYKSKIRDRLKEYIKENPYETNKSLIARELGCSLSCVNKNYTECRKEVIGKYYYLSKIELQMYEYLKNNKGVSKRKISEDLGINIKTIYKYYNKIREIIEKED